MRAMWLGLLKTMRPHQWVKNGFVVAPLVFAEQLFEPTALVRALVAFALFCLVSGAVYLLNDVRDVEKDRSHPVKQHRPIASGVVPVRVAARASAVLAVGAIGAGLWLAPGFGIAMAAYMGMNVGYSFGLKNVPWLDVLIIAAGFLLRVLAGALAIQVHISGWLLGCTFLLALFLGMGKRRHELVTAGDGATKQRRVLQFYQLAHLNLAITTVGIATVVAYASYAFSAHARELFDTTAMPWTIPFIIVGIGRFLQLSGAADDARSPTDRMVRDIPFVANIVGWGLLVVWLIYLKSGSAV